MPSTDDMDRLLKDYESAPGTHWPTHIREPGCSRKALFRSLVITFICLLAVSVGWFLHVTVFIDGDSSSNGHDVGSSILSTFGKSENGSTNFMELVNATGLLDRVNITALAAYVIKHTPPELASQMVLHKDDFQKGDFSKILQDVKFIDGVLDFLNVPDTFPGILSPIKSHVTDYDYENIAHHPTVPTGESEDSSSKSIDVGQSFLNAVHKFLVPKPTQPHSTNQNQAPTTAAIGQKEAENEAEKEAEAEKDHSSNEPTLQ